MNNINPNLKKTDYLRIRLWFAMKLSKIQGVEEIYSCGNIDTPGISDLDFVVFINGFFNVDTFFSFYESFNNDEKYTVGCHYPFFVPVEIGTKYFKILPLSNLHKWDGSDFHSFSTQNFSREIKITILIDICLSLYPNTFDSFLIDDDFNYREAIMAIKAFRFPLIMFLDCFHDNEQYKTIINDINGFINSIVQKNYKDIKNDIFKMLKLCEYTSYSLFENLDFYISKNNFFQSSSQFNYMYINGKNCIFTQDIKGCKYEHLIFGKKIFLYSYSLQISKKHGPKLIKAAKERNSLIDLYFSKMNTYGFAKIIIWPYRKICILNYYLKYFLFINIYIYIKYFKNI